MLGHRLPTVVAHMPQKAKYTEATLDRLADCSLKGVRELNEGRKYSA